MTQAKDSIEPIVHPYSDEELIRQIPGFTNHSVSVNGVQLHYVQGGTGRPLVCLPGWPQTWYSYHPVASELAKSFHVIIVDIRGMGSSSKPETGYDKKTMATDILGLVKHLGLSSVSLVGHDIGGMVAMSFAFNFPGYVDKLIVLDGSHPSEGMMHMKLIPAVGTFGSKMDGNQPYAWWMGFNQVKGLPEQVLQGRFRFLLDWLLQYVMIDDSRIGTFEREVYAEAYNEPGSIRASNGWYQSFTQDIEDARAYGQLEMPVLGIGSYISYHYMKMGLPHIAKNVTVQGMMDSGHYMFEEQPGKVIEAIKGFLGQ